MNSVQQTFPILQKTALFAHLTDADLALLTGCLRPTLSRFGKGEVLLYAGQPNRRVGVVVQGRIEAFRAVPDGSRAAIVSMGPGGVFGDVLGGSTHTSPVTVVATEPCQVLFFPYEKLLNCCRGCPAHVQLLQNLVQTVSDKYFELFRRIDLLVAKSLRTKVCGWLLGEAERTGSLRFTTPMTRTQLAEYLNCDRSALCRELSRMQADGLITANRRQFTLHSTEALLHYL